MRVLLPLKKKLDDPNSQEHGLVEGDESFDSETGEYLVAEDEQSQEELEESETAETAESSEEEDEDGEFLETVVSPAAPDARPVASSGNAPQQPETSAKPSAGDQIAQVGSPVTASLKVSTVAAAAAQEQQQSELEQSLSTRGENCSDNNSEETNVPSGPTLETRFDKKSKSQEASKKDDKPASVETQGKTTQRTVAALPCTHVADAPIQSTTNPSAASDTVAVASPPRIRKRRAPTPPALLDSKPPFKKGRDSKLPAKSLPTSEDSATTTNNKKMAGGSRGGRKLWTTSGASSYYVETPNNGGREDVSGSSDDGAEVDVRFAYNDPASMTNSSMANSSNSSGSNNRKNNNYNRSNSFQRDCGRDDVDVRERDSIVDRPEGDDDLFALALKKQGLEIVEQEGDGNCLFRAISLQVYGDASMHGEVRHRCLEFMARDKEHFSQFITDEPFEQYIQRKRQDGVHGNNPEIQAISELFNRPIEVLVPENGAKPLNIFHAEYKTQDAPIRLSYHDGNHYNAVIDPLVPTAGLGLGLPGLQPGLADKMQMAKAVAESDKMADQTEFERALEESHNDQLQRAIKESTLTEDNMYQHKALSLSDCDATNFELEQAVLESSLESFRAFEHGRKQASSSPPAHAVGRRKRQASLPQQKRASHSATTTSSVASMPNEARQDTGGSSVPRAASAAVASTSVAAAPAVASRPSSNDINGETVAGPMAAEHYPQSVQELVMNGFELRKVVRAYELVGDNFDDLLGFLMSNTA